MIKYSLVIPTLNGYHNLKKIVPYLTAFDRHDVEYIISCNIPDDGSYEYLNKISDSRIRVISPKESLPHSSHLNFALEHAKGEWVGYMGDDDLFPKDRFNILDKIINANDNLDLILGQSVRYVWPENINEPGNTVSVNGELNSYDKKVKILDGVELYKIYINTLELPGGGQFLVNRRVLRKIHNEFGFYCPDYASVEFFYFRAVLFFSKKILDINYPLHINGRSIKSAGNVLRDRKSVQFDWKFENNNGVWDYSKIKTQAYHSVSLNSAIFIDNYFKTKFLSRRYWGVVSLKKALAGRLSYTVDVPDTRMGNIVNAVLTYPESIFYLFFDIIIKFNTKKRRPSVEYIDASKYGIKDIVDLSNKIDDLLQK
jgi:glycosyltransferase involved in cell wall biosynthesis